MYYLKSICYKLEKEIKKILIILLIIYFFCNCNFLYEGDITYKPYEVNIKMLPANYSTNITFPVGNMHNGNGTATLITPFNLTEAETTNETLAAVFQWAHDNGKFNIYDSKWINENIK